MAAATVNAAICKVSIEESRRSVTVEIVEGRRERTAVPAIQRTLAHRTRRVGERQETPQPNCAAASILTVIVSTERRE
jgi:hypothetical protein